MIRYLIILFTLFHFQFVHSAQVALTFDDAPMRSMSLFSGDERTEKLLDILSRYQIKTVFFTNTSKFNGSNGLIRMKAYDQAGHFIANHTHTHANFNDMTLDKYIEDFNSADLLLRQFKNFKPWFRYPMLKHGDTIEKRDGMRVHLKKMKYSNGYVTLDVQDWFMASLVDQSLKSGRKINKINLCKAYGDMIWDTMVYYDSKAKELLGRNPKHMLLLHENDLSALCVESLIKIIKSNDWKIISPEDAMNDEIYKIQPATLFSNNGQIAALYYVAKGIKLHDPWSYPWNDGKLIRKEFEKRDVFKP